MAEARGRADQLARLAGLELGPVVQISEGGIAAPVPRREARGLAPVSYSMPIEAGELDITRIQVTYETA